MKEESTEVGYRSQRTLRAVWRAVFWISFPFGSLSFVLPIYGKELGASAVQVGGFFLAISLVPLVLREPRVSRTEQTASVLQPRA